MFSVRPRLLQCAPQGANVLATLFRICLLRANPQDLPASYALLAITLTAYAAAEVIGLADTVPLRRAFDAVALDVALLVAITAIVLRVRGGWARLPQTLSALAGAGAVLTLVTIGIGNLMSAWLVPGQTLLQALFIAWWLLVYTHVLRHSLALDVGRAASVSVLYLIASVAVSLLYFGPGSET
jgi:hypothetical protein